MVDLKKMFPNGADEWWKSPCETCMLERKKKGRCATVNCARFNNWFARAWKRAQKEVLAKASREGGGVKWEGCQKMVLAFMI